MRLLAIRDIIGNVYHSIQIAFSLSESLMS